MADRIHGGQCCAIVLAAGEGTRLRPLTLRTPKPLLRVGGITLLDRTLADAAGLGLTGPEEVTVNAHYLTDQVAAAVGDRARLLREPYPLGTAGTVAALADWVAARDAVIFNADAYRAGGSLLELTKPATGRARLLVVRDTERPDFDGRWRFAGASLLPWQLVRRLADTLTPGLTAPGLYEHVWRDAHAAGELELAEYSGVFIDCGTPDDYAAANRHADATA
ncbi:MAG TPA: sugar phosphate nucleotidyltransferase [Mycobacteriales bacterium]|jgi:NDP-sugar pyrophosphorylase family protein|nr:sugar phosphate nucleotidyltransferase [Mycobacteriales bacterium]